MEGAGYEEFYSTVDALVMGVRPSKVDYSSGCEPRSGKAGQPLDSKHRVGGGNSKC